MKNQFSRAEKNFLSFFILIIFGLFGYKFTQIEKKERLKILVQEKNPNKSRYEYIVKIMPTVDDFAEKHCLDKWAIIAQICHETDFGKSRIARENNNLLGIRSDGRYAYFDSRDECLRRWYQILAYSGNKHYRRALECLWNNDYEVYFQHIQKGGWAEDKKYAAKCSRLYRQIKN